MKKALTLSDLEWRIIGALWEKGVLNVKETWQRLFPEAEKAYTTVQTYMDRMVEKKLLKKEKIGLVNFYRPLVDERTLKKRATEKFVSNTFNGSIGRLAAFLLDSWEITAEELGQIKKLIDQKAGETDGKHDIPD